MDRMTEPDGSAAAWSANDTYQDAVSMFCGRYLGSNVASTMSSH
jgi:hypothetical protein